MVSPIIHTSNRLLTNSFEEDMVTWQTADWKTKQKALRNQFGAPGMAQLLKLDWDCNILMEQTCLCWPHENIPASISLHYSALSHLLASLSILLSIPPSLHFFFFVHFPLTMGGLRLLHVGGVGFLRVIAGPGAQRNIQINAVTRLPLKSVFHLLNPTDEGRAQGSMISCLTFVFSSEFKYTSTV